MQPQNRIQPHSTEIEQEVLSACLQGESTSVVGILSPSDFYTTSHQKIYQAIESLSKRMAPVDVLSVVDVLRSINELDACGGASYISSVMNNVPMAINLDHYCKVLKDKSAKRRMIQRCAELAISCYQDEEIGDIYERSKQIVTAADLPSIDRKRAVDISNVYPADKMLEEYRAYVSGMKNNRFVTGIHEIDKRIRGVGGGETLFIIARAGAYKTALLQNLMRNYVNASSWGAVFFSLEMPVPNITERFLQNFDRSSGKEIEDFYSHNLTECIDPIETKFKQQLKRFYVVPTKCSLSDMERYVRLIEDHHKVHIGLIGVDYMGLVNQTGKSEYDKVSEIARGSKDLAKFLNIPVVVLSQINRSGEDGSVEVNIQMGRGSGAIEEAADFMLGLWKEDDNLIAKILKNRKGAPGSKWILELDSSCFFIGPNAIEYNPVQHPARRRRADKEG
ncbi:MAG TPA: hypothetical protein DCZ95_18035 [Verrucomicrobia bacterium]|nr:hypothetical protein [Verrucomicrobiota bacterium]